MYRLNKLSPILVCYMRTADFILATEEDNSDLRWLSEAVASDREEVLLTVGSLEVLDESEIVEL